MVLRAKEKSVGAWMFLFGVILAIVIGVATSKFLSLDSVIKYSSPIYAILVLIGLYVGYKINVEGKDAQSFLITSAILVVVSRFGMESVTGSLIGIGIGDLVTSTFSALLTLFVPATIVVAIKSLFSSARV
jgi:xanthosine utilization system XapX-like protein